MGFEQYPDVVMPECPSEKILKGQKALVTGGASGIGRAVAVALGKAGADVVVNYVSGEAQANEVAAEIGKCGSRAFAHGADVSSEEQVQKMFQKMFQEFGTIDILINNAGLQKDAPFDEMTIDRTISLWSSCPTNASASRTTSPGRRCGWLPIMPMTLTASVFSLTAA